MLDIESDFDSRLSLAAATTRASLLIGLPPLRRKFNPNYEDLIAGLFTVIGVDRNASALSAAGNSRASPPQAPTTSRLAN